MNSNAPKIDRKRRDELVDAEIPENLRQRILTEHGDWYGFRMIGIGNYYSAAPYAEMAKRHGLLRDEYLILGNLYDWGPMTANAICTMAGRPKNSVSRGVIGLAGRKLIRTETDGSDRRRTMLIITEEGRRLYEQIVPMFREREKEMFGCLTEEELASLDQILWKLIKNWNIHRKKK